MKKKKCIHNQYFTTTHNEARVLRFPLTSDEFPRECKYEFGCGERYADWLEMQMQSHIRYSNDAQSIHSDVVYRSRTNIRYY